MQEIYTVSCFTQKKVFLVTRKFIRLTARLLLNFNL